ncbi:MAG: hypothetical protein R3A48_13985 [Polyangiales bacterium]
MKRGLAAGALGAVAFVAFLHAVPAQPRRIGPTRIRSGPSAPPPGAPPQRVDPSGNPVNGPSTPRQIQECLLHCDEAFERCSNRCAANSSRCVRSCVTGQFTCRMRCPPQDGGVAGFPTSGLERHAPR